MTDATPTDDSGLHGLGRGIVREAETLDAVLDRSFTALREIRASTNKLVAPARESEAEGDGTAGFSIPAGGVELLEQTARKLSNRIYEALSAAGAPPDVDASARRTADALECWADQMPAELNQLANIGQMPPDTVARILSEARSEAQAVQRRVGAPAGRLMSIMQLRDNMDQRTSHVVSAADIGMNADDMSGKVVEQFLAAQVQDMSQSVREGGSAIAEAIGVISKLTSGLRSQIGLILARVVTPKSAEAVERVLASRTEWSAFKPLSDTYAEIEEVYLGAWTDLMVHIGYQWTEQHAGTEGTSKIAELLDVTAGMLAATDSLDEEAQNMAEAAIRIDALSDSLHQSVAASDVKDNPIVEALWNTYTIEAEREVHNNLIQRLAA